MELSPLQKIVKIEEVRQAMMKSAESTMGAIHPATRIDLNNFYNSCTGCLAAVKQLRGLGNATITETLWKEVNTFADHAELLREEVVKLDPSYQNDGPLVKCLARMMNKGDTVLREVRNQCNSKLLDTFGDDWMNETNERYAKDLSIVIRDIAPCVNYSSARSASRTKAAKEASAKAQQAAAAAKATVTAAKTASPAAATVNTGGGGTSSATAKTESKPILKTGPNAPTPTIAGAADSEKHITFLAPSPYNEKPEQVDITNIPHFKDPNYINLPQFTGVPEHSRPIFQQEMPPLHTTPDAENIFQAPKFPPP